VSIRYNSFVSKLALSLKACEIHHERAMTDQNDSTRLDRVKNRLEELISQIDQLLIDEQATRPATQQSDSGEESEPAWIKSVKNQREVLEAVVDIITDSVARSPPVDDNW
jgi:hypothetical protein